jgi:hypothetical protein
MALELTQKINFPFKFDGFHANFLIIFLAMVSFQPFLRLFLFPSATEWGWGMDFKKDAKTDNQRECYFYERVFYMAIDFILRHFSQAKRNEHATHWTND